MNKTDTSNPLFELAASFVNHTSRHVFLTGRAGTGKTTFLRHIVGTTAKKTVVVAPTGVAAINAGGVTMHSFFQLPLGPFLPVRGRVHSAADNGPADRSSLFRQLRISGDKKRLFQELELLIIDEVSMVRADMLDAMDTILRHFRHNFAPFGGVQVLFIGDLYQLPPVVPDAEWQILQEFYKGPHFFHAKVMEEAPAVCIELDKIYRQNEKDFVEVLNAIRSDRVSESQLNWLNKRYLPDFSPNDEEKYITLTSHNYKAAAINEEKLRKLPGKLHSFKASLEGEFSDKAFPADEILQIKKGAQVMFVKNDKGEERRYYNGKIGLVKEIDAEDGITVEFPEEGLAINLKPEEWKNIRYSYNAEKSSIDEKQIGSFRQYPIRLAWAITIHKSQGLTFEKAIVDAGQSFTAGQVYVALSRLTSIQGLVLLSPIQRHVISCDEEVRSYMAGKGDEASLKPLLKEEQHRFISLKLLEAFRFDKACRELKDFENELGSRQLHNKAEVTELFKNLNNSAAGLSEVADRFEKELQKILPRHSTADYQHLHERVSKAGEYFLGRLKDEICAPLESLIETTRKQKRVKGLLKDLHALLVQMLSHRQAITQAMALTEGLRKGQDAGLALTNAAEVKRSQTGLAPGLPQSGKAIPGESKRVSLEMFLEGKNVLEIAKERGYAVSTIEGHLVGFIRTGEVSVFDLVPEEKVAAILPLVQRHQSTSSVPIKEALGESYSFTEIRAVIQHWLRINQRQAVTTD